MARRYEKLIPLLEEINGNLRSLPKEEAALMKRRSSLINHIVIRVRIALIMHLVRQVQEVLLEEKWPTRFMILFQPLPQHAGTLLALDQLLDKLQAYKEKINRQRSEK